MARHRRNRKLQRRLLTSVPSRRLILENLEDRRLLAVTVADFNNRWLPGLRAELGAAVEESAQLKISLPGVGQTLGALYDVAAHIETARAVALDVQSDGSIQNGDPLAPFLVALDARPEFDVDNVSLPGPNYAAFDLTINLNTAATSQNTTITLPDNLGGLDIKLGSPKITLENRLQIVVRVVIDEVGFVDPAKQLRYENPVSDAARAIYTPLIASPQLNLDGVIAGSLDFDATLKVQLNGGYDFAFGEPTDTPLADLTINTATGSPQLSFDFLGTLDATGPLPQLFYQKEFRYNIPTGAAVNTPQFGGVVVGGTRYDLATPQGRAEVIKKVGGPVLKKIADVIPDPVSKLLLGTVALPGFGITLEELLLGNRPIDFLQAAGVPTFVVTALEKILEIDSFYNQVTGANAGNVGSVQSAAADLGLSFPILTNPTDKILQIFNGKNVDLATYSMDFVQLAIDQFGGMPPPGIITLQPDALGGLQQVISVPMEFDSGDFKERLVEIIGDSLGGAAAQAAEFLFDVADGTEFSFQGDFFLGGALEVGLDTKFLTDGTVLNNLIDSFYIQAGDLFDLRLNANLTASGSFEEIIPGGKVIKNLWETITGDEVNLLTASIGMELGGTFKVGICDGGELPPDNELRFSEAPGDLGDFLYVAGESTGRAFAEADIVGFNGSLDTGSFSLIPAFHAGCSPPGLGGGPGTNGVVDPFAELDVNSRTLQVYGSSGKDTVKIERTGDLIKVSRGARSLTTDGFKEFKIADISSILVDMRGGVLERIHPGTDPAGGGNDSVDVDPNVPGQINATVWFGSGNDVFKARGTNENYYTGNVIVWGGGGDDKLYGGGGNSKLSGEAGKDRLYAGPSFSNLDGGPDNDRLYGLGDQATATDASLGYMIGGTGDDTLNVGIKSLGKFIMIGGTFSANGLQADDPGNNVLLGGFGFDTLIGGNSYGELVGAIPVMTAERMAILAGGSGDDKLYGQGGHITLASGGTSGDVLIGGWIDRSENSGTDQFFAAGDNDLLIPANAFNGAEPDTTISKEFFQEENAGEKENLDGGDGDDTFILGNSDALTAVSGQGGNDTVYVSSDPFHTSGSVSLVRGNISFNSGEGAFNRLIVNDSGGSGNSNVIVTSSQIAGLAPATISYSGTGPFNSSGGTNEGILLLGSIAEADSFQVASTRASDTLKILTQGGVDRTRVGNGDLNRVQGHVTVVSGDNSVDEIIVEDNGQSLLVDYKVTPTSVTTSNSPAAPAGQVARTFGGLTYDSTTEFLRLNASDAKNTIEVSPSFNTNFFIDGNLPAPGQVAPNEGDFLKLDTKAIPAPDRTLEITSRGNGRWYFPETGLLDVQFESIEKFNHVDIIAVGADVASSGASRPRVKVYDAETMRLKFELTPAQTYGANNKYGVRVAVGDMDGDGLPDVVTAPGRTTQPVIKIFSGSPQVGVGGAVLQTIAAASTYGTKFKEGVFLATGDVNGDFMPELILAPGRGAANIKIYSNTAIPERTPNAPSNLAVSTTARTFNAFPDLKKFNGGATVAVGDLNGDADGKNFGHVVVAMGSGLAAQIRAFDASQSVVTTYTKILDPSGFKQGLNVATGDIDGDGSFEIVTGAGSGGNSWVRVYDVHSTKKIGSQINSFRAFPIAAHIPNAVTRVTLRDVDDDGAADIFAVQGQDGRSGRDNPSVADRLRSGVLKRFNGLSASAIDSVFSSSPDFFGGGLNLG